MKNIFGRSMADIFSAKANEEIIFSILLQVTIQFRNTLQPYYHQHRRVDIYNIELTMDDAVTTQQAQPRGINVPGV